MVSRIINGRWHYCLDLKPMCLIKLINFLFIILNNLVPDPNPKPNPYKNRIKVKNIRKKVWRTLKIKKPRMGFEPLPNLFQVARPDD